MNTRNFYQAFSTLYEALKEPLHIQEKGKFYLLLFKDVYPPDDVVFLTMIPSDGLLLAAQPSTCEP